VLDRTLRMAVRPALAICVFSALLGVAPRASGEPAAAEALFREGRRLLEAGRYDEAAAKFGESQAQDPASGTLINLALASEKQGKLATAWVTYRDAAALARRDGRADRLASAERKVHELEPRVPRVVLRSNAAADGLTIRLGAVAVGSGALGSAIPVDPGEYHVIATAPGRLSWDTTVTIGEGETREVVVPELPQSPESAASTPAVREGAHLRPQPIERRLPLSAPHPSVDARAPSSIVPWVVGASGVVSLGIGSVFGVRAFSRYSDANQACPSHADCDENAMGAWREAKTSAWVANIAFAAGIAACGTSAWLLLTRSSAKVNAALDLAPLKGGVSFSFRARL
jgi:hypothetical protein